MSNLRACLKMWRQASLPAVEGGILPPGKTVHLSKHSHFTMTFPVATQFRRAGSPGSTSAKMADATIFRQALNSAIRHFKNGEQCFGVALFRNGQYAMKSFPSFCNSRMLR